MIAPITHVTLLFVSLVYFLTKLGFLMDRNCLSSLGPWHPAAQMLKTCQYGASQDQL